LRNRNTLALLRAITESGLMPADESEQLIEDYCYLTRLENRLRIESDHAVSALPTNPEILGSIARRAGYVTDASADQLLTELKYRRMRVRAIFKACFAREAAR
jgi:glutamate-ammonia-ligase adenylyltransferase